MLVVLAGSGLDETADSGYICEQEKWKWAVVPVGDISIVKSAASNGGKHRETDSALAAQVVRAVVLGFARATEKPTRRF